MAASSESTFRRRADGPQSARRLSLRRSRLWRRSLSTTLAVLLIAWLIFHYLLVWLYVLPPNPISLVHSEAINSYIRPFFGQNWRLFAPRPPLFNDRYLLQLEVRTRSDGVSHLTEWFDLTTPLLRRSHQNPLSSATLHHRVIDGIFGAHAQLELRRRNLPSYDPSPYDVRVRDVFRRLLTFLALRSYDLRRYDLIAVRGRIVREPIPPFSESETSRYSGPLPVVTFDWMPPDHDLMTHPP